MYFKTAICIFTMIFIFGPVTAQYDGEFWWLNKKLSDIGAVPTAPKFEKLTVFDTDESDKIVFRDDSLSDNDKKLDHRNENHWNEIPNPEKIVFQMHFQDKSAIAWPDNRKENLMKNETLKEHSVAMKPSLGDIFEFRFPEDKDSIEQNKTSVKINKTVTFQGKVVKNKNVDKKPTSINSISNNKNPIKVQIADTESEHICTTMKKVECNSAGGVVYVKYERNIRRPIFETQSICCILPLPTKEPSRIHFRDSDLEIKRFKRSEKASGGNINQRLALLMRKYVSNKVKISAPVKKRDQRIATPEDEDYVDPYWNIKNTNAKAPNKRGNSQKIVNQYGCEDYVQDEYTDEMPVPGLVGLYSDHGGSWSHASGNDDVGSQSPYGGFVEDEEDDGGTSFSYGATIDPRLDRLSIRPPVLARPVKIATSSDEYTYDADSQTVKYQSNPDFQVLQGFKLLNIVRNKSKVYRGKKITTTERVADSSDSKESVLIASSFESGYDDSLDKNMQVYDNCGRIAKSSDENYNQDKSGDTVRGSHPWLALVTLTKRKEKIQCYATIVHPKAAVTAADCVHRRSPGDVSIIAGAWDLNAESRENWQRRMVSAHEHSQYRPGDVAYNLAVLHWKRSLRLNANVQPACLSEPHVGDACKFFGWGGYDQAIRRRPMWQAASILTPRLCDERLSSKRQSLPSDAFCTSVESRRTVTGIGGSLICEVGSRQSAVGVAVWRDDVVVLIPAHEWIRDSLEALGLL